MTKKDKKVNFIHGTWFLSLSYRGTNYHGWQRQREGHISVQEVVETSLRTLFSDSKLILHGSGRTDSGVHALSQSATFEAFFHPSWTEERLFEVLRSKLPEDIILRKVVRWESNMHARFSAHAKTYIYVINNSRNSNPFESDLAYKFNYSLDVERMIESAKQLIGTYDFSSFAAKKKMMPKLKKNSCENFKKGEIKYISPPKPIGNIRTIYQAEINKHGDNIFLTVTGSGFLYKMVRSLVGHLLWVGQHKCSVNDTKKLLLKPGRNNLVETAPARGLYLAKVFYEPNIWQNYTPFKDSFFPYHNKSHNNPFKADSPIV